MERILISSCLIGLKTRYDGKDSFDRRLKKLHDKIIFIPVCPEILGGLSVPRLPASIYGEDGASIWEKNGCVLQNERTDVTVQFRKGALLSLDFASFLNVKTIILKDGSPSCGIFTTNSLFKRKKGIGITAYVLRENGFVIETVESFLGFR